MQTEPDARAELARSLRHMDDLNHYRDELQRLQAVWDNLTLLGQLSGTGMDMSGTREAFHDLSSSLLDQLGGETLRKCVQQMRARGQVAIDILVRNLFERTADIGFLATDDDLRRYLTDRRTAPETGRALSLWPDEPDADGGEAADATIEDSGFFDAEGDGASAVDGEAGDLAAVARLRSRFGEYVAKYSVYHDIVLLDPQGRVLARLDDRIEVASTSHPMLVSALHANAPYLESFGPCDLLPGVDDALIYAARVDSARGEALGVLCLCFRFEDEMSRIFSGLVAEADWSVILLLADDGRVIASSDPHHIQVGVTVPQAADGRAGIVRFAGREYLSIVRPTGGYQGYVGPGWRGCVMLPLQHAFERAAGEGLAAIEAGTLAGVMANPSLFSPALRRIPAEAASIQRDLNRAVWNGNMRQADPAGRTRDPAFSRILLHEISSTGARTKDVFERSIAELHQTVVSAIVEDSGFLASLAIDIMDRNLYERANDCRWWALTTAFRQALDGTDRSARTSERLGAILAHINGLYTVYSNLIVFDAARTVVAVSAPGEASLVGSRLEAPWCAQALSLRDTQGYVVSAFEPSPLYDGRHTYVYAAAIQAPGSTRVVGGIGIVFDSTPQFQAMLHDALPRSENGQVADGAFAVFVDAAGRVLACSDARFAPGEDLPDALRLPVGGAAVTGIGVHDGDYYAIGARRSAGYREYKGPDDAYRNDVSAYVCMRLGDASRDASRQSAERPRMTGAGAGAGSATVDIATFRIGGDWFGLKAGEIVEAVETGALSSPVEGRPPFVGYLAYEGRPVATFDLAGTPAGRGAAGAGGTALLLRVPNDAQALFALRVDELGEIASVDRSVLRALPNDFGGRLALSTQALATEHEGVGRLLPVLDPGRLAELAAA